MIPWSGCGPCNPVPAGQLDDLVWTDPAQALFQRIVATPTSAPVRVARPPGAGPPSRPAAAGGCPGWRCWRAWSAVGRRWPAYALVGRQPSKPQTVACFAAADLTADDGGRRRRTRQGPVAACAGLWARGFGSGPRPRPLRACVLESGVVGVFPEAAGRDVCLDLGLAAASSPAPRSDRSAAGRRPPSGRPDDRRRPDRFFAFRDAVLARFVGQGASARRRRRPIVREELDRAGLGGWTVTTGVGADGAGFSAERRAPASTSCPRYRSVDLVPVPPAG